MANRFKPTLVLLALRPPLTHVTFSEPPRASGIPGLRFVFRIRGLFTIRHDVSGDT